MCLPRLALIMLWVRAFFLLFGQSHPSPRQQLQTYHGYDHKPSFLTLTKLYM